MNMFNLEHIYKSIIEPKRPKYIFHYCILDTLGVFPIELVLYILELEMHYMKHQLDRLVNEEKALISFMIIMTKAFKVSNHEYLAAFPNNPETEEAFDKITTQIMQVGKEKILIGDYSDLKNINYNLSTVKIAELRPFNISLYDDMVNIKNTVTNLFGYNIFETMNIKNMLMIRLLQTKSKHMEHLILNVF
jgi:hypothetical protein